MDATSMLVLMALLLVKHYVADFPLQYPVMYLNKGRYGAWGGIAHALMHGWFTGVVVLFFSPEQATPAAVIDFIIHYNVDWLKVSVCAKRGWSEYLTEHTFGKWKFNPERRTMYNPHLAIYSNAYFQALGLDQLVHVMTYVFIAAMVVTQ